MQNKYNFKKLQSILESSHACNINDETFLSRYHKSGSVDCTEIIIPKSKIKIPL